MPDRVGFVSGAGRGIGAAVALRLADGGAAVVVNDRDPQAAAATVAAVEAAGGTALAATGDVSRTDEAARCVAVAQREFGRLDYAYNNAAVPGVIAPTADYPAATFWRVMQVNLGGVLGCLQAEVQSMRETGGGSIVNAVSAAVAGGVAGSAAYAASKHAVVGLTKSAALDHAADDVRVNAVAPGLVDTGFVRDIDQARFADAHPVGRRARTEEIAAAVCWLLTDSASFVTGTVLAVDGGLTAQVAGL
ncbi:MAG: SDR family oxidoreductase [Streptosporangiales bacterium]|nr:SDR family oxidoreductase [Streptosporangiales bacterium]